ncbi:hypothetical protein H4R19_001520 [Coemansia spiralis]|nr:hypothetical protein H4R19_001520 [Coemansia spiralis]
MTTTTTYLKRNAAKVVWAPGMRDRVSNIATAHTVVMVHLYAFLRYFLTHELSRVYVVPEAGETPYPLAINLPSLLTGSGISKLYQQLCRLYELDETDESGNPRNSARGGVSGVLRSYLVQFKEFTPFRGVVLNCPSNIAAGAATRVATEYTNTVRRNLSPLLHRLIRHCLDIKGRTADRKRELLGLASTAGPLQESIAMAIERASCAADTAAVRQSAAAIQGVFTKAGERVPRDLCLGNMSVNEGSIDMAIRDEIIKPAKALYSLVCHGVFDLAAAKVHRNKDALRLTAYEENIHVTVIAPILGTYGSGYSFNKSVYYDAMTNPHNHFAALFVTARKLELLGAKLVRQGIKMPMVPQIMPMGSFQTKHVDFTRAVIHHCLLNKNEQLVLKKYQAAADAQAAATATADGPEAEATAAAAATATADALTTAHEKGLAHGWLKKPGDSNPELLTLSMVLNPATIGREHRPKTDQHFFGCFSSDGVVICPQYMTSTSRNRATYKGKLQPQPASKDDNNDLAACAAAANEAFNRSVDTFASCGDMDMDIDSGNKEVTGMNKNAHQWSATTAAAIDNVVATRSAVRVASTIAKPCKLFIDSTIVAIDPLPAGSTPANMNGGLVYMLPVSATVPAYAIPNFNTGDGHTSADVLEKLNNIWAAFKTTTASANITPANMNVSLFNMFPVSANFPAGGIPDFNTGETPTTAAVAETPNNMCAAAKTAAASAGSNPATKGRDGIDYVDQTKCDLLNEYKKANGIITVDPGRRDIIYAVNLAGKSMRYTSCEHERTVKVAKHKRIRQTVLAQHREVSAALNELSQHNFRTLDVGTFDSALRCWGKRVIPLIKYHGHAGPRTRNDRNRPTTNNSAGSGGVMAGDTVDGAAANTIGNAADSAADGAADDAADDAAGDAAGDAVGSGGGDNGGDSDSDSEVPLISLLNRASGSVADQATGTAPAVVIPPAELAEMLAADCSAWGEPLHMKLRLNSFINRQKADMYLDRKIMAMLGNGTEKPLVIFGDWSTGNAKNHDPLRRGQALCQALINRNYPLLLIDEFRTSKLHSLCGKELVYPKVISRPRPPPKNGCSEAKQVKCHGLLACTNEECWKGVQCRKEENAKKRKERVENGERMPVPPTSQQPKRQLNGYNKQWATAWERKNFKRQFRNIKYKLTRRVRTKDVTKCPEGSNLCYVNRDYDAGKSMHTIVQAHAEGEGRPDCYRRPTAISKLPLKRKGRAGAPPKSTPSSADKNAGPNKRRRK